VYAETGESGESSSPCRERYMNTVEKLEEVAKVRKYLNEAEIEIARAELIPRQPYVNKFDFITAAILSKAFSVARASVLLIENGLEDDAYAMCRSVVECAWTLRYLTQEPESLEKRTWKYINFLILDKQPWMYQALMIFKDEEMKADVHAHAKELELHEAPTEIEGHWSGQRGFAWFNIIICSRK
jgi:uncharacterized protein DUF5677